MVNTEILFLGNAASSGRHLLPRALINDFDYRRSPLRSQPATSDKLQSANSTYLSLFPKLQFLYSHNIHHTQDEI